MIERFYLDEHKQYDLKIPSADADELKRIGAVSVTPLRGGRYRLKSRNLVGVVRAGDTELWIRPKVTVDRLLYLAGYGDHPSGHYRWLDEEVELGEESGLVAAMAMLFIKRLSLTFAKGLLHGYKERDATLNLVRGRVRTTDQARRRSGLPLPLEVRFDDLSVDILENQFLLAAARALLELPDVPAQVQKGLRQLATAMAGVGNLPRGDSCPPLPAVTRVNARYQPALQLAWLILQARSAEHVGPKAPKNVLATSFVFDMNKVFEHYVGGVLQKHLSNKAGGKVDAQMSVVLYDSGTSKRDCYPDLVWRHGPVYSAVLDVKYFGKRIEEAHGDHADGEGDEQQAPALQAKSTINQTSSLGVGSAALYQMFTYCKLLRLTQGHLIHANPTLLGSKTVRIVDVDITVHGLDLGLPLDDLRRQEERLADSILAGSPAVSRHGARVPD